MSERESDSDSDSDSGNNNDSDGDNYEDDDGNRNEVVMVIVKRMMRGMGLVGDGEIDDRSDEDVVVDRKCAHAASGGFRK